MSALLHECGNALYGERWQQALGRDLGVSPRTIQRYASGTTEAPIGLNSHLMRLCIERAAQLDSLTKRLKAAG